MGVLQTVNVISFAHNSKNPAHGSGRIVQFLLFISKSGPEKLVVRMNSADLKNPPTVVGGIQVVEGARL